MEFQGCIGAGGLKRCCLQNISPFDGAEGANDRHLEAVCLCDWRYVGRWNVIAHVSVFDCNHIRMWCKGCHALGSVFTGSNDVARSLKKDSMICAPLLHCPAVWGCAGGGAASTLTWPHLLHVAIRVVGQRYAGAVGVVVVGSEVITYSQQGGELFNGRMLSQQVVVVQMLNPHFSQDVL